MHNPLSGEQARLQQMKATWDLNPRQSAMENIDLFCASQMGETV
jgi:hypothetical protein